MFVSERIERLLNDRGAVFTTADGEVVPHETVSAEFRAIRSYLLATREEGDLIAIRLDHGYRYLLCIYACMQIGLPYLPLRKGWPESRVEQIRALARFRLLIDDTLFEEILRFDDHPSRDSFNRDPERPLYVICTSGTTGEPKGVVIQRRAYENFLRWLETDITLGPAARILFVADFTFDMSLLDIGLLLLQRCSAYFTQFSGNIFRLAYEIETFGITSIATVPNNLNMLLQDGIADRANFSSLRHLLLGGSRFSSGAYRRIFTQLNPHVETYNFYGPTEATVYCHYRKLSGDEARDQADGNVTVGAPARNVACLLLDDERGHIQGSEAPGELLVGGVQVMKEYLNDPLRTRSSLTVIDGVTYYRTGDLGFRNRAGDYFITGRIDETIKRRGYRVNLLDIDSYIQGLDAVQDSRTIAIPDENKDHLLVTYVIPRRPISAEELRKEMSRLIVDYQVPDHIEFLRAFPTNNSGKVNRLALTERFLQRPR